MPHQKLRELKSWKQAFSTGICRSSSGRLFSTSGKDPRRGKKDEGDGSAREAVAKGSAGQEEIQMATHCVVNKGAPSILMHYWTA